MKHLMLSLVMLANAIVAFGQIPSAEIQIKGALLSVPEEKRAGAMVYGYDAKGAFTVLRKGTNELICLADNLSQKGLAFPVIIKI